METIEQLVIKVTSRVFKKDVNCITPENRFIEDFKAKSLSYFAFQSLLEEEFNVDVNITNIKKAKTVSEVIEYIKLIVKEN